MRINGKTDVGMKRKLNEDSILMMDLSFVHQSEPTERAILILCDGMGGHNAGEVASKMACRIIIRELMPAILNHPKDDDMVNFEIAIKHAIKKANEEIYEYSKKTPEYKGMGTTVSMCVLMKNYMFVGHVGDSRVYIINDDEIIQITKDHSLVQELIDMGKIRKEEAISHPKRNVITRAVGVSHNLEVDTHKITLFQEDKILLCSDGLYELIYEDELKDVVGNAQNLDITCDELIKLANDRGGSDNISVIIAEPEPERTYNLEELLNEKTIYQRNKDKPVKIKPFIKKWREKK